MGVDGISAESPMTLTTPIFSEGPSTSNGPDLEGFLQAVPVASMRMTVLPGRQDSTIPGHESLFVINMSGTHNHPRTWFTPSTSCK